MSFKNINMQVVMTHSYIELMKNYYFQIPSEIKGISFEFAKLLLACGTADQENDDDTIDVNHDYFNRHPLVNMLKDSHYSTGVFTYALKSIRSISCEAFAAALQFEEDLGLSSPIEGKTALLSVYKGFKACILTEQAHPVFEFKSCIGSGSLGSVAKVFYDLVIYHQSQNCTDEDVIFQNIVENLSKSNINAKLSNAFLS